MPSADAASLARPGGATIAYHRLAGGGYLSRALTPRLAGDTKELLGVGLRPGSHLARVGRRLGLAGIQITGSLARRKRYP